jgi:hypothetical protein
MPQPQPIDQTGSSQRRDLWSAISKLNARVSNHDGRWVIVGIVLIAGLGWVGYAVNLIGASTAQTAKAVASIDKTLASYIASSTERINQLVDRVGRLEDDVDQLRSGQ